MYGFPLKWLFVLTTAFAVVALCMSSHSPASFFCSCFLVPLLLGATSRYFGRSHEVCCAWIFFTSIGVATLYMAWGSYVQTFVLQAKGYLVGDGWNSVMGAAVLGVLLGIFSGFAGVLAYSTIAWGKRFL